MDFIGFTYNRRHSVRDLGILRVSSSNRYSQNLAPTATDITAQNAGADGQYFFDSFHKQQQFTLNIAFDSVTETQLREMRQLFNGREEGELIFDEYPYKAYMAKITGSPNLKTVCFMENGQRVYKGEGTLTFTCYRPYAHTPTWVWTTEDGITFTSKDADGRLAASYSELAYPTKSEWIEVAGLTDDVTINRGELAAPFVVEILDENTIPPSITVANTTLTFENGVSAQAASPDRYLTWDSSRGLVYWNYYGQAVNEPVLYYGNAYATIPPKAVAATDQGSLQYYYWYY